jgi:YD repeat-containing protein
MKQKHLFHIDYKLSIVRWTSTCILLVFFISAYAQQQLPNQVLPSPTTMLFQKYGDYPVSHYTGIPDIKIPVYTISEGDISVPIYFSFHASGLNLNDQQGIIGPNWTLHTGGLMSRTINGLADEFRGLYMPDYSTNFETSYYQMKDTYDNYDFDHELDVYSYNFLGRSGKFIPTVFTHLIESPTGQPYDPFMLKADNLQVSIGNITDENGIGYHFGGTGREELTSFSTSTYPFDHHAIATWHLASISSTKHPGVGVSYSYQQGPLLYTKPPTRYIIDDQYWEGGMVYLEEDDLGYKFPYSMVLGNNVENPAPNTYFYSRVPQRINFSTGYLLFILDSTKMLTKIEIYNKDNELLRSVELVTNKYGTELRSLEALVFKDGQGVERERYSFAYYSNSSPMSYYSASTDYWGYYNAKQYMGDLVPRFNNLPFSCDGGYYMYYQSINFGGLADRSIDVSATKSHMLQKITYPTGGYTTFDYEGNANGLSQPVGGLRIKNISSFDRTGALAGSKNYSYEASVNQELHFDESMLQEDNIIAFSSYSGRRRTFSEYPSLNLSPKGAPIGYHRVTETEGPTTTVYNFDDGNAYEYQPLNFPSPYIPSEPTPHTRQFANHYKPWNFGDLVTKEVTGPGFYKKEFYNYESFIKRSVHDLVMNQHVFVIPSPFQYDESYWHDYFDCLYNFSKRYHHSGVKRLMGKGYFERGSDGREIHTGESYTYADVDRPMLVTTKTSINSKNETIKTDLTYPHNYTGPIMESLAAMNRVADPIEEVQKNMTVLPNQELSRVKVEYDFFNQTSGLPDVTGYAHLRKIKKSVGGADPELIATAERYDARGHILQQKGKDGIVVSFIYGYNENYPVAKIVGADYVTAVGLIDPGYVNNSGGSISDADMRLHLSILRSGLPDALVTTYTYRTGVGMTSETDPKGQTSLYEYDNFQRLQTIKNQKGEILKKYEYHVKH